MYVYRNKKTGETFSSPCICSGDNWEMVAGATSKVAPVQPDDTEDPDVLDNPDDTEDPDTLDDPDDLDDPVEESPKQDEKKRRGRRKADA